MFENQFMIFEFDTKLKQKKNHDNSILILTDVPLFP